MPSLDDLREIVDRSLRHVTMTDEQKASIRRRAAETHRSSLPRRYAVYGTAAVAAVLAVILLVSYGIPRFTENEAVRGPENTLPPAVSADKGSASESDAPTDLQRLSVRASDPAGDYVSADTAFLITGLTEESVLSVSPDISYTLTASENGTALVPSSLSQNTVYNISIYSEEEGLHTWAFQTEASLSVTTTLPAHLSSGFSPDTGIEIVLSQPVSSGADAYFSISPEITGHLEYDGYTLVFIPDASLPADTAFTVTLAAGLTSDSGAVLAEDYSFSFRTPADWDTPYLYLADSFTESYLPSDPIAFTLRASASLDCEKFTVRVWELSGADEYLSLAAAHERAVVPTIGYASDVLLDTPSSAPVFSFTASLARPENDYWDTAYLVFPETLPSGRYLAEVTATGSSVRFQKLIQISELSVYAETLNGSAVVWVYSSETGEPCPGISVSLGSGSAVTDSQGLASFRIGQSEHYAALRIGEDRYADYIPVSAGTEPSLAASYYTFLYTDRSAYQPTDSLCFWGRILPRSADGSLPQSLDLYLDGIDEGVPELTVSVAADGTFSGTLDFSNLQSYGHNLYLASDGQELLSYWFSVQDYTKPAYILTLTADRSYYRAGEPITLTASGTFYDGTPAEGLEIEFRCDTADGTIRQSAVLDADGRASLTYTPTRKPGSWYPALLYCTVNTSGAEDVWVDANITIPYYRSDTMLTAENLSETGVKLEIRANSIDFSAGNPAVFDFLSSPETLRGDPVELTGTYTITRHEQIRRPTGRTYDPIHNVSVENYEYDYVETDIYTGSFRTENGFVSLPEHPLSHDGCVWYLVTIRAETPDGASLAEKLYISTPFYTHDTGSYSLRRLSDADIAVGSDVSFTLYRGMEPVTSGTMLISAWHDALLSASVSDAGSYTLTFTEEHLPNVLLSGAYFDGTHIHPVSLSYVSYSSRERELNISIETDAASYAPGAEALVTLRITDADGNPVSTPFALGVVDNAAFAVMEQYTDPLSGVYAERYFEGPVQYHSYVDHTNGLSFAAEGGGEGGGGSVRDDFKDTAAFLTGVTGADGTAAVRFTLPDNLTSWRLTAVAVADVSGHPYAGKGVANVSTGLPYFLNVVYNEEILTGDDFSLSLRTVGGGAPQYTVTLSGGSVDITREIAGSANGFTYVNLGTLPAGVYTLTVRARSGELADAVSYPVSVVESRQEIAVSSCFALSDGVQLDSLRYPVRLSFCDAADADALRALSRASVAGTSRLDGALASVTADRLLRDTDSTAVLDSFRDYTGAFRLFSYGDATAEATAWMLLISPESVGTEAARRFLYNVLYTRDSASYEVAYAYMGLAALGEPILADVRLLLRSGNNLTLTDELSLAVSLALLGDTEEARTWYEQNRSRIGDPADSDEAFSASLLSMVLCRLCGMDAESHALFEAILDTPNDRVSPAFALLAYLTRLPAADASASFAYVLGGKRHTVSFADVRFFTLTLSESELAAADFRLLSGEVEVCASFVSSLEDAERSADGYSVTQVFSGDLTPGGRAVLTVQVQLPDGTESAELSLALPAGMRYVGMPDSFDHTWWVTNEENGRVRVFLYADETSRFTVTLNLRCVLPGTYRAEPAVVTDNRAASAGGSIAAVGGGTRVTIQ